MKFSGLWLDQDKKCPIWFKAYSIIILVFGLYTVNFLLFINWIIAINSDIKNFASMCYIIMIVHMGELKSLVLLKYRKDCFKMVRMFQHETFQPKTSEELEKVKEVLGNFTKLKNWMTAASMGAAVLLDTFPLFHEDKYKLPMSVWYPININYSPLFEIMYLHQAISIVAVTTLNVYTEAMIMGFLTFVGLQCDLLSMRIENLEEFSKKNLEVLIKNHWFILRLFKLIKNLAGKIYFTQIFASTITYCMDMYLLTIMDIWSVEYLYILTYQLAVIGMFMIPCWLSTEMTLKSERIAVALYNCNWFAASESFKKDMMFFMMRTQRPLKLLANDFFYVSLELFLKMVRTSLSYFAVLMNIDSSSPRNFSI
ncbi:odorant receptor 4-like [Sitophilus oryzae]|uniref:Odorant receptor n=1 Tax=Sitophilus oryzae TaxID=7048 RepID=A0A6J2X6L5_SITOR|nr:odorant receptor 4-like [Sitophilus oryzae]